MVVKENTKYKETEIGMIPEDWEVKKISQITTATAGGTPSTFVKEYWSGNILWMNSGELNNKRIFDVENRITDLGLKNSSTKLIPSNSVLIGLAGQGKTRGTAAINYVELCTNQSIAAIFPSDSFISEYLYFNLDFRYDELRLLSTGDGGRGGLNLTIIKNLDIAFPSKSEQQTIANTLTDIDQLINSLEKIIIKKLNIKQGAIQELLSGRKRLPRFKNAWRIKDLGEIAEIRDGTHQTPYYVESGVPFYSVENVTNNDFRNTKYISEEEHKVLTKNFEIEKGDILMTRIGSIGECKLIDWNVRASFYVSLALLKITDSVSSAFIYHYSLSDYFKKQADAKSLQYATPKKINLGEIAGIKVFLPFDIEEQVAIAQVLSDMDSEIDALETKLAKYQKIKQGMMENLLTGRIRLV